MSKNYKLSSDAKADLNRIYRRGFEEFGEQRADQYFRDFFDRFEQIADNPKLYPKAQDIDENLCKSVCGKDIIYYEVIDDSVIIQFILGRQDIRKRLKERRG